MGDYDNKPDAKRSNVDGPRRALPPAPKPKAPMATKAVPSVEDLVSPTGPVATQGLSSAALLAIASNNVDEIYNQLGRALAEALEGLKDPPAPPDHSRAIAVLAALAETLASIVVGHISHDLLDALKARQLSDSAIDVMKDQLKAVTTAASKGANLLVTSAPQRSANGPADANGVANPSATTLLAEFGTRMKNRLGGNHAIAKNQLVVAMERVQAIQPAELEPLVNAVGVYAGDDQLGAWFQEQIAVAWLNFSASLSLGEREAGQTVMPDANKLGGSKSVDWKRPYSGFVEINIDFPDEVHGMEGVSLGQIRIASEGPGAARIFRASVNPSKAKAASSSTTATKGTASISQAFGVAPALESMGLPLSTLPVFRRLWLGTNNLDRTPDVVITPDNKLEVNTNSALLAAVATGKRGRFIDFLGVGEHEEAEEARLLAKYGEASPPRSTAEGRLGTAFKEHPAKSTSHRENVRLGVLASHSVSRAHDSQQGAAKIVAELVGKATTEDILP